MIRLRRTRGRARRFAAVLIVTAAPLLTASSVDTEAHPEAAVKAAFLFRFAGYVDWPRDANSSEPFEFAVVDDEVVAAELRRRLPGHSVNGRVARVREHMRPQDVGSAEVVYLAPGHARRLRDIEARLGGALVVTDEERGLASGATINFVRESDRLRFEVSLRAAARAGIRLRAGLLSVAARVERHDERPGS